MLYEPLSLAMLADPYSFYEQARRVSPVMRFDAAQSWLVLDYRSCTKVLTNPAFARDPSRAGQRVPHAARSMQNIDPPELFSVRAAFLTAASRRTHRQALLEFERFTRSRLHDLRCRASFDMVAEVCAPACALMVSLLLGIKFEPSREVDRAVEMIILGMDAGIDPARASGSFDAKAHIDQLLAEAYVDARGSAQITEIETQAENRQIGRATIKNTMRVMFSSIYIAGTTALANACYWLLRDRSAFEQLRAHPDTETAGQELVRFDSPVHLVARTVISPCQLGGHSLQPGDEVVAILGSANRDPAQFSSPENIDLLRSPNRHLGFSAGPHSCLASGLAREMVSMFCRSLVTQQHRFWLAEPPVRLPTVTMRRIQKLTVSAMTPSDLAGDSFTVAPNEVVDQERSGEVITPSIP